MIPIKLEFQAFGPFAKKQVIDFTLFDSEGIFLISGKTGSGKTTIFDAISFCLYGVASGEIRQADSFKSDFAEKDCICYVEFEFIVHGKRYKVRREPIQYKLKRNGNYVRENSTAEITFEDGTIISGTSNVDPKVEEILGINADQFKKIVMLPQGEFRKFLSDDSNEKQKILRKIFSTKVLDDFTEKLRLNASEVKADYDKYLTLCNAYIDSIRYDDNDNLQYAVQSENKDISYIIKLLKNSTDETNKILQSQKQALIQLNNAKDLINIPYAKDINSKFQLLEQNKTTLSSLNFKRADFENLSNKINLLKQLKEIVITENAVLELKKQQNAVSESVALSKKTYETQNNKLALVNKNFSEIKLKQAQLPEIISKIQKLKQKLEKIKKLDCLKQDLKAEQQITAKITDNIQKLEEIQKYVVLSEQLKNFENQNKSLKNIYDEILKCRDLTETFLLFSDNYKHKMNCFVESQAFFLAGGLKDDFPCPVCGSNHHPNPAKQTLEVVSQDELEKAKYAYDTASQKLKEQQTICKQLLISAEFDIKLHSKLSEFLPEIKQRCSQIESQISSIKLELTKIDLSYHQKLDIDDITLKLNSQKTALAVSKEKSELIRKNITDIGADIELNENQQQLNSKIKEYNDLMQRINMEFDETSRQKDALSASVERCVEAINQQSAQLENIQKSIAQKQSEFERLIFEKELDFEEYNTQKNELVKLAQYENQLLEYNNQVTKCKAVIDSLATQLDTLSITDITALEEKYQMVTAQIDLVSDKVTKLSTIYNSNSDILKKLSECYSKQESLADKYNEYQRLCDIANGKYSDRINFERYVLASYFNDVIKNANVRLEQMTNSRYTLNRRTDKEKGTKSSGLALEVFDVYTGISRHVNTLSGGESFKISLCLALGLADIISENSGGIELNTMFIDEGFGSLDSESLDAAIECLNDLRSYGRYIGIISHVTELKEKIPSKLFVVQNPNGSYISLDE